MTAYQEQAISAIEAQQAKVKARSHQWMVGEQLKDICRREPASAELIAQDLSNESMSITEAEKKIKAFADSHKGKRDACFCVTLADGEDILRKFYGLPAAGDAAPTAEAAPLAKSSGRIDPLDFL